MSEATAFAPESLFRPMFTCLVRNGAPCNQITERGKGEAQNGEQCFWCNHLNQPHRHDYRTCHYPTKNDGERKADAEGINQMIETRHLHSVFDAVVHIVYELSSAVCENGGGDADY